MQFEFSEETHQWCIVCAGNIRKNASHCRFCHMHIGSTFQPQEQKSDPAKLIDGVACWLPDFNKLVLRCSPALQERFRDADMAYVQTFRESDRAHITQKFSERSANVIGEFPPAPVHTGLLYDILLNLNECGEDIEHLCAEPTLVLLEITAEGIVREAELRTTEQSGNNQCKFCQEYIFSDSEQCRFCESKGQVPPEFVSFLDRSEPDLDLLTSILLWEAARRQADSQPPIPAEILEFYQITSTKIAEEVDRQRANPTDLPLSRWRRKTLELQLKTQRPLEDLEMYDLLNLGLVCRDKDIESEIVYNHGLRRVNRFANPSFAKQLMLDGLEQVYFRRKDYEAHHRIKKEARELRLNNVPEHMRQPMIDSEKATQAMLQRVTEPGPINPQKQIEQRDATLSKFIEHQQKNDRKRIFTGDQERT